MERIPFHAPRPTLPHRVREWLYDIPNGNRSYEEWQRAHHLDLPPLTDAALLCEGRKAQLRVDYEPAGTERLWLLDRLAAIRCELRQREGRR